MNLRDVSGWGAEDRLVWFGDDIVPLSEATVNAMSATAQFGLNVFEGVRGYWSTDASDVFLVAVDQHLRRLRQSASILGLRITTSDEAILDAMRAIVVAGGFREDVSLRVICMADEIGSWSETSATQLLIAPVPARRTRRTVDWTLRATVSSWRRIADDTMPARVKTGANYVSGRYAMLDARSAGFDLPILLSANGKVSEAPGSSLALVRDGVLSFPPLTSGILEGITRRIVASIADEMGIEQEVRDIDRTELLIADELFVCGSAVEIRAVGSVDRIAIGDGGFGPVVSRLLDRYHTAVDGRDPINSARLSRVYGDQE